MALIATIVGVFVLLVGSEVWFRHHRPKNEFSRKFIHIVVGSLAASWPFYLSWTEIMVLSAAFIVVVSISKYFDIFKAIHAVERPTMGEIYFALAVGLLAFITHQPWVYAVALLHMSLADGLAAVMGVTYGKSSRYQVFGHTKSVIGSLTFLVVSIGLLGLFSWVAVPLSIGMVIMLAAGSTLLENLGGNGLDNLLVPLVVGAVLHSAV